MKKFLLLVLIFVVHINMYSQYSPKKSSFSYFSLGLYGGFSTDDFVLFDTSSLFEIKTNLTQKLFVHLSTGYNSFDKSANIDDVNSVSYEYKIIPVSLGASYFILHGHSSPYLIMEGATIFAKIRLLPGQTRKIFLIWVWAEAFITICISIGKWILNTYISSTMGLITYITL